jgi:hypothetical protein
MKAICLFSPEDADLAARSWKMDRDGYAYAEFQKDGIIKYRRAHRVVVGRILRRELGPHELVDHIHGNRLDNRRSELRLTTPKGNSENTMRGGRLRGACFRKELGYWRARVHHHGKNIQWGKFSTADLAASAARTRRKELGFLGAMD